MHKPRLPSAIRGRRCKLSTQTAGGGDLQQGEDLDFEVRWQRKQTERWWQSSALPQACKHLHGQIILQLCPELLQVCERRCGWSRVMTCA